ncbi:hypothetical protein N7471_001681 [Penicillium samsonianum]|uniref:uncharacterized protein n=1 Tax=Penicillium samsonianum TaxID=1882272 RepID=UPI002547BEB8|nr:uncharacterized protein N7471_001681 [Penicillium samsonianum]KAJ6150482.1 hypothetical protein N7471_001681 [Penicillium samsonianum]
MSVMTRFVSFVSLNHPRVIHEFHGPIPIAACQSKVLGLYCYEYRSRYSALQINDLVSGQITFGFTFSTPPCCLFCHEPQMEISGKPEGKKDAEKRDDLCRMHKIHINLI